MSAPRPPEALDRYASAVHTEMRQTLAGFDSPLHTMGRYHLGWLAADGSPVEGDGGKGLRSTLCLLACEAVGGEHRAALPAAAALELLHNFSLVHDDIQDGSPERRHRPAVWALWGSPQAINVGDSLFAFARLALLRLRERGVAPGLALDLAELLDRTCLRLCEGQYLDLTFQDRQDITIDDYLAMIDGKTAALIATACAMGAAIGSKQPGPREAFHSIGHNLGLAFQIRDDVLGIWGVSETTGKPVAEDIFSKKKSYPVVHAFNHAPQPLQKELTLIYAQTELLDKDAQRVLDIFAETGAQRAAEQAARGYCDVALDKLHGLGLHNGATDQLAQLARFAIERAY